MCCVIIIVKIIVFANLFCKNSENYDEIFLKSQKPQVSYETFRKDWAVNSGIYSETISHTFSGRVLTLTISGWNSQQIGNKLRRFFVTTLGPETYWTIYTDSRGSTPNISEPTWNASLTQVSVQATYLSDKDTGGYIIFEALILFS